MMRSCEQHGDWDDAKWQRCPHCAALAPSAIEFDAQDFAHLRASPPAAAPSEAAAPPSWGRLVAIVLVVAALVVLVASLW